ncbi:MAG: SEC59/DGK1/VTE5 family protein [Elusimicrobiota bacterium]|nr:SEC59/DGK1/VTE5 family protein [Elusimicrobiota bacterium]
MTPEAKRKISHWFILLVPFFFIFFISQKTVLLLLAIVMTTVIIFELLRLKNEKLNQKLLKFFDGIYRENEAKNVSTLIFTLSGIFFTILFFEKEIALLAIFFLTFGDGFAALVGEKYGKHKIFRKKSWVGVVTNLLTCLAVGLIFSHFFQIKFLQIFFGSLAATVVEILPVKDNLLIPIVSAFVMTII